MISSNLKSLRENARITQAQLARLSGVHRSTIKRVEDGTIKEPKISLLQKIADGLAKAR